MNPLQNAWIGRETDGPLQSDVRRVARPLIPMPDLRRLLRNVLRLIQPGKIRRACPSVPLCSEDGGPERCRWFTRHLTGVPAFISEPPWDLKQLLQQQAPSAKYAGT